MPRRPLVAFAALSGCLGDPHVACTDDTQCREAFGFAQVCGDAGYCEDATFPARCGGTELPANLDVLADPAAFADGIILASVHDHAYDVAELQSVRLAFIEAEQNGGLDGVTIGLIECTYGLDESFDDLDENGAAAALGEFLTGRLGVQGYIGPYTSGQSTALFTTIDASNAFIISPSATSPALTTIDGVNHSEADPGTFWRTAPPDSLQGQVAAEDMLARGRTKVAVVYFNDSYGIGLASVFAERFEAEDGGNEVVRLQFENGSELGAHVAAIQGDASIEEIFMISGETADIATFLNVGAVVGGFDDDPDDPYPATGRGIFLSDAAKDTDLLAAVSDGDVLFDQIRGTAPSAPDGSNYSTFQAAYQAEYGTDPRATIYMPYSYDAGWLALYAATWSVTQEGGLTGPGMGKGMRHMSAGTAVNLLPSDWNTARATLSAGDDVDVEGTSGPLDFDPVTEETSAPVDIWRINDSGDGFELVVE